MVANGQCMCGAVDVTLLESVSECLCCHCSTCVKQGAGGGTYEVIIDEDKVKFEGTLKEWIDKNTGSGISMHRYFCGDCGTPICSRTDKVPGKTILKLGVFAEIPRVSAEWFCRNKQSWEPEIKGAALYETSPPKK